MNREERILIYINSSDDFVVNGKRYCENDFYNDVEDLVKENKELKEHIEKHEHYCKTTGIEELMKENKKYKEAIDKAIKLIEKTKERRILRLLEMDVLDILKEVE